MTLYAKLFKDFKAHYMAYIALSIIFQSCLASVAVMLILKQESSTYILQLAVVTLASMLYNTSILAQMPLEWVFRLLGVSIVLSFTLIICNIGAL
ncbi:MAG: hypothetical protein AB3N16_10755 [Flavobacteriaceae bacterium]